MCGGGGVEDNSDKVAEIEADSAAKARADAEAKRIRDEELFAEQLNSAYTGAIGDANSFFTSQGLNPEDYAAQISSAANTRKGTVPLLDTSPGTYFANLGKSVYDTEESGQRNRGLRDIDSFASTGFAKQLITDTADDPFITSLLEQQYGDSEQQIQNQKARGVLTDSGLGAALKELTRQKSGAQSSLESISSSILEQGRGTLRDTANDGRTAANNLRLGSNFNPFSYQETINSQLQDFFSGLGGKIEGAAPTDLFDVSRAFSRGGIGQGAQNTAYDPSASAGLFALFDENTTKKKSEDKVLNAF